MKIRNLLLIVASLLGASGVAAAAASSHAGADLFGPYALNALTHAPALLALGLLATSRALHLAAMTLAAGAVLFCADLAMRHFTGNGLFPYSAPLGGFLMIAGWLLITIEAVAARRD